jgi:hypothetical protein
MNNLDMACDHLYAAHKGASKAGDYDTADRIVGILKKIGGGTNDDKNLQPAEDRKAGLAEEDNLEDDDDLDGKPSTNDPEPDDLEKKGQADENWAKKIKEGRNSRGARFARRLLDEPESVYRPRSKNPAIRQLQEDVDLLQGQARSPEEFAARLLG